MCSRNESIYFTLCLYHSLRDYLRNVELCVFGCTFWNGNSIHVPWSPPQLLIWLLPVLPPLWASGAAKAAHHPSSLWGEEVAWAWANSPLCGETINTSALGFMVREAAALPPSPGTLAEKEGREERRSKPVPTYSNVNAACHRTTAGVGQRDGPAQWAPVRS